MLFGSVALLLWAAFWCPLLLHHKRPVPFPAPGASARCHHAQGPRSPPGWQRGHVLVATALTLFPMSSSPLPHQSLHRSHRVTQTVSFRHENAHFQLLSPKQSFRFPIRIFHFISTRLYLLCCYLVAQFSQKSPRFSVANVRFSCSG